MRKETYFAVFEPTESRGYSIYFPEVAGCSSAGDDYGHAYKMAEEALGLHLYGIEKDGAPFPAHSETLAIEPETAPGYLVSPITVYPDIVKNELNNKAVKTNVTIPAWLKELAEERGVKYSEVFEAALMDYLGVGK
jgi:predicted RNase H-like HicB family nuclease